MTSILPLSQNFPLVTKDGMYTPAYKRYIDEVQSRIGGINGGIYSQLTATGGAFQWDLNQSPVAVVQLANGANTLSPPVNMVAGYLWLYRLTVIQPASGAKGTISWPRPPCVFAGGAAPTLSSANGAIDELVFDSDGTNMKLIAIALNFS